MPKEPQQFFDIHAYYADIDRQVASTPRRPKRRDSGDFVRVNPQVRWRIVADR